MSVLQQIRKSEQEKTYLRNQKAAGYGGLGEDSLDQCRTPATQTTESLPGTAREQTVLEILESQRENHLVEVAKISTIIDALKKYPQIEGIIRNIVNL